jgi:phosphoglycerol transferase
MIIVSIGVYDQSTPANIPKYKAIKSSFDGDADFVRRMEAMLPVGAMVFELPFSPFPEQPRMHNLTDYELGKPYLHSFKLKWSYGALIGRESGDWQKSVVAKSLPDFLKEIRRAGFKGLYIDRRGYEDNGLNIEKELRELIQHEPIVSLSENNSFFCL